VNQNAASVLCLLTSIIGARSVGKRHDPSGIIVGLPWVPATWPRGNCWPSGPGRHLAAAWSATSCCPPARSRSVAANLGLRKLL